MKWLSSFIFKIYVLHDEYTFTWNTSHILARKCHFPVFIYTYKHSHTHTHIYTNPCTILACKWLSTINICLILHLRLCVNLIETINNKTITEIKVVMHTQSCHFAGFQTYHKEIWWQNYHANYTHICECKFFHQQEYKLKWREIFLQRYLKISF